MIGALFLAITRTPSVFQSMREKLSAMIFLWIQNLYDIKSSVLIACFLSPPSKAENQLEFQQLYQNKNANHDAVIPRLHIRNCIFLVVNSFNNCIFIKPDSISGYPLIAKINTLSIHCFSLYFHQISTKIAGLNIR